MASQEIQNKRTTLVHQSFQPITLALGSLSCLLKQTKSKNVPGVQSALLLLPLSTSTVPTLSSAGCQQQGGNKQSKKPPSPPNDQTAAVPHQMLKSNQIVVE